MIIIDYLHALVCANNPIEKRVLLKKCDIYETGKFYLYCVLIIVLTILNSQLF